MERDGRSLEAWPGARAGAGLPAGAWGVGRTHLSLMYMHWIHSQASSSINSMLGKANPNQEAKFTRSLLAGNSLNGERDAGPSSTAGPRHTQDRPGERPTTPPAGLDPTGCPA